MFMEMGRRRRAMAGEWVRGQRGAQGAGRAAGAHCPVTTGGRREEGSRQRTRTPGRTRMESLCVLGKGQACSEVPPVLSHTER